MELNYDHHCFGCGTKNPQGLKLKFRQEGDVIKADFMAQEVHQGYPGLMHGGISSTLMDEIMSQAINFQGNLAMTARLEVRFRSSIPINQPMTIEGWIVKRKGPLVETAGRIVLRTGQVAVEASGRFMIIEADKIKNREI